VVVKLPETFENLREAYASFRSGADKIDPAHLKQIEAAGGMKDPKQRGQALQDIDSQAEAQKSNTELIERLKKENPDKSSKEIAELAKGDLKVPNVPFGFNAEDFKRAQTTIKDALAKEGSPTSRALPPAAA